jgi:pimeloyl-ACP methyl ester carboxylesterase
MARVIALHSGGMSSRQWRRFAARLGAAGHEVITPDFRGHGDGVPWPDEPVTDFAFDVAAVERLIVGPTHLVGHSYGGLIALLVARGRTDVASVAVYEPIALGTLFDTGDEDGLRDLDRLAGDPCFTDPATRGDEDWLRRFVDYWSGAGAWDALGDGGQASFRAAAPALADTAPALAAERTPIASYTSIGAPVLLVRGDRSPLASQRVAALLANGIPRARMETVDGAGHMGPLTHRDRVEDLIVGHIASIRPST